MEKPYSPSCDRNKNVILEALQKYATQQKPIKLFEIGSGTGQHAAFIAQQVPHITWLPSDTKENHSAILEWTQTIKNIEEPLEYQVGKNNLPILDADIYFTANTLHIMSWEENLKFFENLSKIKPDALLFIYGPFNYSGEFTSESNRQFNGWLFERNRLSGIRNFEDVEGELIKSGFDLMKDIEMPANNRTLIFKKARATLSPT